MEASFTEAFFIAIIFFRNLKIYWGVLMSIIVSEPVTERGHKDARRHREKQRDAIIDKLPEIIANESIITRRENKIIKIPIKSIDLPHFRRKSGDESEGIGQGGGQPGDIIGSRPGHGQPGEPGQEPGEDYIETEVKIEEIIELMLEDLGLPKLEEKEVKNLLVEIGYKIGGIVKSGPWPLLNRRATGQEGMRRFYSFLEALKAETGLDDLTCFNALKQAGGILEKAIEILKQNQVTLKESTITPFLIPETDDLRYQKIEQDTENQSNAVIIAMRDVSGSMNVMKVYLCQAMLFWLVNFLKEGLYKNVKVRFITHHSTAKLVDEEEFFKTGESGGTNCYTAYELANGLIETEYLTNRWNVYVWHFSDGEDGNIERTIEELEKLINKGVNMVGYGEVQPDADPNLFKSGGSELWQKFKDHFSLKETLSKGLGIAEGEKELPLLCVQLTEREHVLPALKAFLKKDRWSQ